jgi:hypothetical protein
MTAKCEPDFDVEPDSVGREPGGSFLVRFRAGITGGSLRSDPTVSPLYAGDYVNMSPSLRKP